jgi:hypothetical protein
MRTMTPYLPPELLRPQPGVTTTAPSPIALAGPMPQRPAVAPVSVQPQQPQMSPGMQLGLALAGRVADAFQPQTQTYVPPRGLSAENTLALIKARQFNDAQESQQQQFERQQAAALARDMRREQMDMQKFAVDSHYKAQDRADRSYKDEMRDWWNRLNYATDSANRLEDRQTRAEWRQEDLIREDAKIERDTERQKAADARDERMTKVAEKNAATSEGRLDASLNKPPKPGKATEAGKQNVQIAIDSLRENGYVNVDMEGDKPGKLTVDDMKSGKLKQYGIDHGMWTEGDWGAMMMENGLDAAPLDKPTTQQPAAQATPSGFSTWLLGAQPPVPSGGADLVYDIATGKVVERKRK